MSLVPYVIVQTSRGERSYDFRPDLIHCHDWQTGLIPVYLKTEFYSWAKK